MTAEPLADDAVTHLVAENVRSVRRLAGITQDELARAVGISRSSIVNIEHARQGATVHTLYRIAYALGVSVCDLMPSPNDPRPWVQLDHTPEEPTNG